MCFNILYLNIFEYVWVSFVDSGVSVRDGGVLWGVCLYWGGVLLLCFVDMLSEGENLLPRGWSLLGLYARRALKQS